MKDIRQKLLATFQIEHRDHVEQIRSLLAIIGMTAGQPGAELEEAFRRAHSLKGAARAVDLRSVEGLAHRLETLFSRVRQGALPFDEGLAAVVQQALDASEDCVMALGEDRPTPGFGPALQAIERALGMEADASAAAAAPPERTPSQPEEPRVPAFQPLETVRITAQNFDGLLRSAAGLLGEHDRQSQMTGQLTRMARQISEVEKDLQSARRAIAMAQRRLGQSRELSRLSFFLDSLDQKTRSVSRQAIAIRQSQQRDSWAIRRLNKQLQQDVWQARMAPAENLLEGYRKMMRDLARDEGKEIEFRASSTRVHADRGVLDALKDPLMHALRNAVSHGIESPRERAAAGKPPAGLVALRVETEGQRLAIAIEDDGRGVDIGRVAEVAVRQKILSSPEAARLSHRELAAILCRPGFSTSRSVTDLSGRGMGLSVVCEAVRRMQGEVELQPREGGGTILRLSVPLSISTHRLLLVRCGGQLLAIPIHAVERLLRMRRENLETLEGNPFLTFGERPLPLFSLQQLLKLAPSAAGAGSDAIQIVILRSHGKGAALVVDAIVAETEAVIQELGPLAARDAKISGGIVLDDGAVAFVLDIKELIETHERSEPGFFATRSTPAEERTPGSILVVDDSMTTRTLERIILEAHGYRVRVAVDGVAALEQLHIEKADLVIADVQMPRMDGLELLQAIKRDPNLEHIPVIIVTSLDRREDKERGLGLGADAYLVKQKFDQEELLATIRQIL